MSPRNKPSSIGRKYLRMNDRKSHNRKHYTPLQRVGVGTFAPPDQHKAHGAQKLRHCMHVERSRMAAETAHNADG
jgi:hypothetical protein